MPTKKNKIRDLKPAKDAKGGGGRGTTQGGGAVDGGRGTTQNSITLPGAGKGGSKIVDPRSTEGATGGQ